MRDSSNSRPFGYCMTYSIALHFNIFASVIRLFFWKSPSAIFRLIVTIIVNSINAVFGSGRLSHIGKEVIKHMPAFANCNPSASVIPIALRFWIFASVQNCKPCPVDFCSSFFMSDAQASTGFNFPLSQMLRFNRFRVAAFTFAEKVTYCFRQVSFYYSKTTELLAREVNKFRHNLTYHIDISKSISIWYVNLQEA